MLMQVRAALVDQSSKLPLQAQGQSKSVKQIPCISIHLKSMSPSHLCLITYSVEHSTAQVLLSCTGLEHPSGARCCPSDYIVC